MRAPVSPGDILLDKYRIERILGQGGMGVVVAARHVELGELFAIKFLLPHARNHPQAVERFVREARASARLKGEHVAKVHDVGRLPDGLPYMVLEHLTGKDLKLTLRERGPLPVDEAVTYVIQTCEALGEAHQHGIVHRDLKPANLFLTRRHNGTPCVKVLDFGISRQIEPEDPEQQGLTKTGMVLGTPYYMSPEQMTRSKEVDPRSDIWSLGCVLYELLTGRLPFRAEALTELVGKVLQEEPAPPSAHRSDIPPAVEAVVMRCLAKRREHRFQSVEELAEALRGPAQATATLVITAPTAVLPAAVPAAGGSATSASTSPGWGKTAHEAGAGASMPRRRGPIVVALMMMVGLLAGGAWLALRPRSPAIHDAPASATQAFAAPSIATETTSSPEAASAAPPSPPPTPEPTSAEVAARVSPSAQPPQKSRPVAPRDAGPSVAATSALPVAKPSAEPTAAPPAKKRNTMY
jgi:serine/threonine-protein kinase